MSEMDVKAWISVGAAVISIIAMILSWAAAARARNVSVGSLETTIRSAISQTRGAVRAIALQIASAADGKTEKELQAAAQQRRMEPLRQIFAEAVEDNLNAYEDACAKYLDKKIDRERFKKMYSEEIRGLCTNAKAPTEEMLHPEATSKFRAIWKVYRMWHVAE
jgi:hypothetical protein